MKKLTERDKRALKIGVISAAAIIILSLGWKWTEHWIDVRKSLAAAKMELSVICPDKAKTEGVLSIVPAFEMPGQQQQQMFLFRDKLGEQFKKSAIKNKPLQVLSGRKSAIKGYGLLPVKCKGECNFGQLLDFLANLNENPYLAAIEELRFSCDPQKRDKFEIDMTVTTLINN